MSDMQSIATAPGDLPAAEIARRYQSVQSQFRHDNTSEPGVPGPGVPVTVTAVSGMRAAVAEADLVYTTDRTYPGASAARVRCERTGTDWLPFGGYVARWEATIPGQEPGTVVRYRIVGRTTEGEQIDAQDGQGFWYRYAPDQGVTTFAYRIPARPLVPEWFRDAVIYQIFVDRYRRRGGFVNSDDLQAKHGGELAGITESLPYLEELGVNCLWLSPVGPAASYHRYDATDYFAVDPLLGSVDDMKALTAAAHACGMRVILDFVPSHFSRDHEFFRAARQNPGARTRDWFYFYEWPDRYRSFLEVVPTLVSLNTESRGVRDHLIRSARFWIECGIDGFRLDHVIGHGMDFWVEFQEALEEVRADIVNFGEATDTGDALRRYQGRMNGVLDFPLARALRLAFATGEWTLGELDSFLDLYDAYMADGPARLGFLDNHDMDRFLHVAGQDRDALLLAALCMLTLPQIPVIYYGTEIGMTQEFSTSDRARGGDALAREDMVWNPDGWDADLRERFARLIAFRRSHSQAVQGPRRTTLLDSERGVFVYTIGVGADDQFAVVFNTSGSAQELDVPGERVVFETTTGTVARRDGITVAPRSGAIVSTGARPASS